MRSSNFFKLFAVILSCFAVQVGQCCINEYRVLLNGKLIMVDEPYNASPVARFNSANTTYLLKKLKEVDSIYRKTGKLEDYSDLGSMLIYAGQYLKAKQIFQDIEKKSPGRYQTAANLGTTYELLGENNAALFWIKRAIQINPSSHKGSEWIHQKILEAKVKANGDSNYLWTHRILPLDFGDDRIPVNNNRLKLLDLERQLYEQLTERMSFIKPTDPIVAQLLFDLGNVCALTTNATSALQVYQTAKKYGCASPVFRKRLSYFQVLQLKADVVNNGGDWAHENSILVITIVALVIVLVFVALVTLFKRIKKKISQKIKQAPNSRAT